MPDPVLELSVRDAQADAAVITAVGDIDYSSHTLLRDVAGGAVDRNRIRIVLELSGVRICDSTGLSVFVQLHRRTTARGGWFRIAAPRPLLVSTLAITYLDRLLPVYDSVDAALKAASEDQR
jgi:anti-sigma B factor antagonist